jgi:hypothetical protein
VHPGKIHVYHAKVAFKSDKARNHFVEVRSSSVPRIAYSMLRIRSARSSLITLHLFMSALPQTLPSENSTPRLGQ